MSQDPLPDYDIDERLAWLLRKAGEEWGPLGVAKAAAALAHQALDDSLAPGPRRLPLPEGPDYGQAWLHVEDGR